MCEINSGTTNSIITFGCANLSSYFVQDHEAFFSTENCQGSEATFQAIFPFSFSYDHYADTAQFRDPVSIAKGKLQIQSQFNGMPKLFSNSETKGPPIPLRNLEEAEVDGRVESAFE